MKTSHAGGLLTASAERGVAEFLRSAGRLNVRVVVLGLQPHRVLGQELQSAGRMEPEHHVREVRVDLTARLLPGHHLPAGTALRAGEEDALQGDPVFEFTGEQAGQRSRHFPNPHVVPSHQDLHRSLAGIHQQIEGTGRLQARAIAPLRLFQRDLVDVLLGNPVPWKQAKDGVTLADMEPIVGTIEADERELADPLDQIQRIADRMLPNVVQNDRAVPHGVLKKHGESVKAARFRIKVEFLRHPSDSIETREIICQRDSFFVVRQRCICLRCKKTQIIDATFILDLGHPLLCALVPEDALIARRVAL